MSNEFKSFVDIVSKDERFWIEVKGARFLCRRLSREEIAEIERQVYPEGREALDSEIGYINEFLAAREHGSMTPVQIAGQAKQLGARLAELRRTRQEMDEQASLETLYRMVMDWQGVGSLGKPAPCTRESKGALPYKVAKAIIDKVKARANAQDEISEEEEGN